MEENVIPQQAPQTSRRKKIVRYIFIGAGSLIGFILLAAILIPLLFEGQVKKIFIRELNKNLATAVVVDEDDIDLTLFKNFPNATIVFHNAGIRESIEGSKKNFADAGEISLVFNVRDIIKGNYVIHKIILQDATINLLEDKAGNINYKFWKDSESESHKDFSVVLEEVICKNIHFVYASEKYRQNIAMLIHNASIQGNFTSDLYTLKTEADLLSEKINMHGVKYLENTELKTDVELLINNKTNTYSFKRNEVQVGKNSFFVEGQISDAENTGLDLKISSKKADIETVIALLPAKYARTLQGIESKGKINFNAAIKGVYGHQQYPLVNISFNMEGGTLYHTKFKDKLTDVNCSGSYTNGSSHNKHTSAVEIKNLKAKYAGQPLSINLAYRDFSNPYIDLQIDGDIPAAFLLPSANKNISDASGFIAFENVSIKGNTNNLKPASGSPAPVQGNFSFHDIVCTISKETIQAKTGTAQLKNGELQLQNFTGEIFGSPVTASITLDNWLSALFSGETDAAPVYISGMLNCETFDLKKTMALFSDGEKSNATPASAEKTAASADHMNWSGTVKCSVGNLTYDQLQLKSLTADIKLSQGMIGLNNFTGRTMNGNFNLQTIFRRLANGNYLLENIGILNNIDIQQLFTELNNFDQTTLTDKNIKGKATAYIENASVQWDKNFHLLEDKIYVLVNIKIENGELLDYEPLNSLSSFVDIKELKHITFSTLQNQVEIKNSVIIIPAMQIQSSALNLSISGSHTFDNKIDYQMKLSLADLLAKKFFGKSKNKDNYESDAGGGINIYVSMTGTVENPVIKYNKKEAKIKMQEEGGSKPSLIDIFKPDEPQEKHDLFKKQDRHDKEEPSDTLEFIDWEDEQ